MPKNKNIEEYDDCADDEETISPLEKLSAFKGIKTCGRHSMYEPWMCQAVIDVAMEGGHKAAMAARINAKTIKTLDDYAEKYPEFAEAYHFAVKVMSLAVHEEVLLKGATGQINKFNANAFNTILHNKFPEEYKNRNANNVDINITNNTLNLTPEQIDMRIQQTQMYLKSMGVPFDAMLPAPQIEDGEVIEADDNG